MNQPPDNAAPVRALALRVEFKPAAVARLVKRRHPQLIPFKRQHVQRMVDRGTEQLSPYVLMELCSELECLPTDILRAV